MISNFIIIKPSDAIDCEYDMNVSSFVAKRSSYFSLSENKTFENSNQIDSGQIAVKNMDNKSSLLAVLIASYAILATSLDRISNIAPATTFCDTFGSDWHFNETIDKERQVRVLYTSSCPNHYNR